VRRSTGARELRGIALRSNVVLAEIDVGRLVAGKYELVRLIGKGAMGEVWLATHNSLGGEFAIKVVQPSDDEEDETAAGRFQLEAQVSAKLSRKTRHIVSVSDHGEEEGLAYLVMELLEGESLEARIKRTGEMPLAETVAIVMQVARALGQAHGEGIFHRDLKPANVFLTKDEDGRLLVKLLDFGIARTQKPFRTRSPFATGKDMVLGTPSYMSPEQARGLDTLDHRCDLWALAVVAYEALTRSIPWEGETVEDIFLSICTHRMIPILARRNDLPPVIEGVFARSFAPKLDDRFSSASDLSDAFEALVDPLDIEAAMGAPAPRIIGSSSRRLQVATPQEMPVSNVVANAHGGHGSMLNGYGDAVSDPVGVAVGEPTLSLRRKKSSGWLLAVIAALATIGIVVLALTAFSSRNKTTAQDPPTDSTTVAPATHERPLFPAPVDPPTATTTVASAFAPPKTPVAKTPQRPVSGKAPAAPPIAPTVAAPPPTTVTPVVAPPPPPPPPASATPRKPGDKSEVF
jgi:eukaryotic-like serine/threonine-protein kinase